MDFDFEIKKSSDILESTVKINIFTSVCIILLGLIGHSLTIFLYSQKRFRLNSSNIYLLCLAITDGSFLIIHFFEDTIRTYINIYDNSTYYEQDLNSLMANSLNITDNFEITCRLINYARYVLRFISAYIIVAFTLQRLFLIFYPSKYTFKSKKSAWFVILAITMLSLCLNCWVPIFFETRFNDESQNCDLKPSLKPDYFHITMIYICLIMLIPIFVIFICNSY